MPKIVDHQQRKRLIAQGAISAIAQAGVHKVTMTDIAKASNCTTGMVNHYFEDKNHVLIEALNEVIERVRQRIIVSLEKDPADLQQIVLDTLPLDDISQMEYCVWREFWQRAGNVELLAKKQSSWVKDWTKLLSTVIQQGQKQRQWREDLDVMFEANLLGVFTDGLGIRASLSPEEWPAHKQKEYVNSFLARLENTGVRNVAAPNIR